MIDIIILFLLVSLTTTSSGLVYLQIRPVHSPARDSSLFHGEYQMHFFRMSIQYKYYELQSVWPPSWSGCIQTGVWDQIWYNLYFGAEWHLAPIIWWIVRIFLFDGDQGTIYRRCVTFISYNEMKKLSTKHT